jgi:crotonobetainyl-CoA:carnitine CoA-transferase CaiB-like acyl-CoA transferase
MRPLSELRVLDLTHILAGPYCTRLLSDAGADVIKIEYESGDAYRHLEPFIQGKSVIFANVNRGKKSLGLNLKTEEGLHILLELAKKADVLVENFRPGTTKKLGLDYDSVSKLNPRIVYCSISGYGQTGPYATKPGYDLIAQAEGGLMALTGDRSTPSIVGTYVVDFTAATYAALAILMALNMREKTGKGQYIDVALLDSALMLTGILGACASAGFRVDRIGNKDRFVAPYGVFRTSNGYVAIACFGDRFFQEMCKALGLESLATDPTYATSDPRIANEQALNEIIEKVTSKVTTEDLLRKLDGIVPSCRVVEEIQELMVNEQIKHRESLITAEYDGKKMFMTGVPFRFSDANQAIDSSFPSLGEHTEAILRELGYDSEQISAMSKKGIVQLYSKP